MTDTSTPEGRDKRLAEIVLDFTRSHNFRGLTRLIGGAPQHDLADYSDADAGEPPKGAQWN
jgi:hypothetical protein